MRRSIIALLLLLAIGSAVIALVASPVIPQPVVAIPDINHFPTATRLPSAQITPTSPPTRITSTHSPTVQPSTTVVPTVQVQGYAVRLHPDGELYIGDQVSFEVIAPKDLGSEEETLEVNLPQETDDLSVQAKFAPHGIGARLQADLLWAWDTSKLAPGTYQLRFSILPGGPEWIETVTLLPVDKKPIAETQAHWVQTTSQCCKISYISGTAAERDIQELTAVIDREAQRAADRLGTQLAEPVEIFLMPRILGHGGFAGREISLSYLDRDYIGGDKARIIHHEIVHILDGRLGGELRPSMLVEGFAVYLSGGHFKQENLLQRAAALLPPEPGCIEWSESIPADSQKQGCGLDQFVPLKRLINNFYFEQHEIGYLESGALVNYMVNRWGWTAFSNFYRDMHPEKPGPSARSAPGEHSNAVEAALAKHFGLKMLTLEHDFRSALAEEHVSPQEVEDLRLSLLHYDTARRYQAALDPSAHFLTAWLLDSAEMQKRGITADYLRHPIQPENLALETMLVASGKDQLSGDFVSARRLLESANRVLDAYPQFGGEAFFSDPLAADYLDLVNLAVSQGYEPQNISITNQTAQMWVSTSGPELKLIDLIRKAEQWMLLSGSGARLKIPFRASYLLEKTFWVVPFSSPLGFQREEIIYGVQLQRIPLSESNGAWQ